MGQALDLLAHDEKLVATQPGQRVSRTQQGPETVDDEDEQGVARPVAEAVVHDLEAIEVEEQHTHRPVVARRTGQGLADPVEHEGPVGQTRERVVQRLMSQLLLDAAALGDVPDDPGEEAAAVTRCPR